MLRLLIRIGLVFLVLSVIVCPSEALRSRIGKNDRGYKDPGKPKTLAGTSSGLPSQNASRRGLGISAWGLVLLIVSMIMAGMGFYYFSLCYPLCQGYATNNKYDKMSLPTMA